MTLSRLAHPLAAMVLAAATLAAPPIAPLAAAAPASGPDSLLIARADAGRIQGSANATVWLVEASDFQCPFCKQWHDQSYATVIKEYVTSGRVRLAYLNDPLSIHAHAMQAAEAAMCASAQDKFWPMHEALYATQHQWEVLPDPTSFFDALAVKSGVNAADWRSCVSAHATRPLIEADQSRLRTSGVQATPTFFIGSLKLEGVQPIAAIRQALDAALAKSGKP